jgi:hypothetical protein
VPREQESTVAETKPKRPQETTTGAKPKTTESATTNEVGVEPGVPPNYANLLKTNEWSLRIGVPLVLISSHEEFMTTHNQLWFQTLTGPSPEGNQIAPGFLQQFSGWLSTAAQAVIAGELPTTNTKGSVHAERGEYVEVRVKPGDLVGWFIDLGLVLPEELSALKYGTRTATDGVEKHPAHNPEHPFHSKELSLALRLWERAYRDRRLEEGIPPGGPKKLIRKVLHEFIRDQYDPQAPLCETATNRIVTVVNPRPEGGVTWTPTKKT